MQIKAFYLNISFGFSCYSDFLVPEEMFPYLLQLVSKGWIAVWRLLEQLLICICLNPESNKCSLSKRIMWINILRRLQQVLNPSISPVIFSYSSRWIISFRYENVLVAREEGRILYDVNPRKPKKTKAVSRVWVLIVECGS